MYYVYVLHCNDEKLYTGYTPDLKKRLERHKRGFVKSTKNRRPLKLIHYEAFLEKRDAEKREKYLKGGNGKKELEILLSSYFSKYPWKKNKVR